MADQGRIDRLTVAAIGAVSGLLMLATHEIFGHSLVTVLLGAHFVHVTNVDSSNRGPATPAVLRIIAAAGITANILAGAVVLWLARVFSGGSVTLRYFMWVYGHATLFMGSAYLVGFALLPFGDVRAASDGLPAALVLRVGLITVGIAIYWATLRDAARTLYEWTNGDKALADTLTLLPYLAMGITNTLAALFNPAGPLNGALWAAAATFGANAGLLVAAGRRMPRAGDARCRRLSHRP